MALICLCESSTLMKTIATFSKPEEAHLFRTRLEAAGIAAFVQDEHLIQMDWLYSNALGGVRIQVPDQEVEAAREFLAADTDQKLPDAVAVVCPVCGSEDTKPDELPRRIAFLTLLLFFIPLLFSRRRWKCQACNHLFRAD